MAAEHRFSRRVALTGAVATALGATGVVALRSFGDGPANTTAASEATSRSRATVAVERRTLRTTERTSGTLGFGPARPLTTRLGGTVTELASEGSIIEPGGVLLKIDQAPVELFAGAVPAWRELRSGVSDGPDVMQLEDNLARLGFGEDLPIDAEWTSATTRAVKGWQEARGLRESGVVEFGRIVFAPDAIRIGRHQVHLGDAVQPGTVITEITDTSKVISVDLDARRQELATVGSKVDITLPDGTTTAGTVSGIGTVASSPQSLDQASSEPATVDVTITLDSETAADGLDGATVEVSFTSEARENVLAVPVTALLALVGGGYGLERVTGDVSEIVPVEPGMYADGWVEITGDAVVEGDQVVTA